MCTIRLRVQKKGQHCIGKLVAFQMRLKNVPGMGKDDVVVFFMIDLILELEFFKERRLGSTEFHQSGNVLLLLGSL